MMTGLKLQAEQLLGQLEEYIGTVEVRQAPDPTAFENELKDIGAEFDSSQNKVQSALDETLNEAKASIEEANEKGLKAVKSVFDSGIEQGTKFYQTFVQLNSGIDKNREETMGKHLADTIQGLQSDYDSTTVRMDGVLEHAEGTYKALLEQVDGMLKSSLEGLVKGM
jgi:hypothetical protein